jgi:hypothetical protein
MELANTGGLTKCGIFFLCIIWPLFMSVNGTPLNHDSNTLYFIFQSVSRANTFNMRAPPLIYTHISSQYFITTLKKTVNINNCYFVCSGCYELDRILLSFCVWQSNYFRCELYVLQYNHVFWDIFVLQVADSKIVFVTDQRNVTCRCMKCLGLSFCHNDVVKCSHPRFNIQTCLKLTCGNYWLCKLKFIAGLQMPVTASICHNSHMICTFYTLYIFCRTETSVEPG